MQSAALAEAIERGREPFPVLTMTLVARGLALGTEVCAPAGRITDAGQVTRVTRPGGWERITYGAPIAQSFIRALDTSVSVSDADGSLLQMLDTYDPRGSACVIQMAAPGLLAEDWEPVFVGILEDWESDGPFTRVHMKTDDTALRSPIPSPVFGRSTSASWRRSQPSHGAC